MENREEETDNEEEINNIVGDLGNLKIDNNEWKEELCYEKGSILGFYKNSIQDTRNATHLICADNQKVIQYVKTYATFLLGRLQTICH